MNSTDFLKGVIKPTLAWLHLESPAAEALLLGTALAESGLQYLFQLGGGPALGVYQMEPATHDDIWKNYAAFRPALAQRVVELLAPWMHEDIDQLVGNLPYATAMARLHYLRVSEALPETPQGMARYWKRHYNTASGAGTVEGKLRWFQAAHDLVYNLDAEQSRPS